MKTRGAASGSLISGLPRVMPDSARRAWTVHRASSCMVGPTSSSTQGKGLFFLQGQKETREKTLSQPNTEKLKKKISCKYASLYLLIYVTCQIDGSRGPRQRVSLTMCGDDTQISGSSHKTDESCICKRSRALGRRARKRFHLVKITFVCAECDEPMETPRTTPVSPAFSSAPPQLHTPETHSCSMTPYLRAAL